MPSVILATAFIPGLGRAIGFSALAVLGVLAIAFIVGRIRDRYRDIDVFWPLGFVAVAVSGFIASSGAHGADSLQRGLILGAVTLWGLRLAIHLAWRSRGEGEDPRYAMIIRGAKGRNETLYALIVIYGLQAALMFFVSLTVTVGMFACAPNTIIEVLGAAIWVIGFGFEAIGDFQLESFKKNPANSGKVMDKGLWAWTRHPNYFGDATAWWGIFIIGAAGGWGLLTVLSPLLMTRLLTSVSGKPLLERRMAKTREGFEDYVNRTSAFLPRPPKRPRAESPN
jgi:steroid 5-alpha reductase family enzyme